MTNYYTKLYAQNQLLDQFDDEVINVSNNSTGLFDIDKLPSDFTRQLSLPGTKKNNSFFFHYYNIDVDNPFLFSEEEKVECYLDVSGYLLVQGYLQLNDVVMENNRVISYDVTLYGSVSNLSRDLRTTNLTDLDSLSVYNHTSSLDNISSSWDGNLFNGDIVYPLVDYGRGIAYQSSLTQGQYGIDNENGLLNIKDFKPAIRTKKVVDYIFEQLGYTYSSSFFDRPMWDDIYTLCDRGKQFPLYEGVDLETYGEIKIKPTSGSTTDILLSNGAYVDLNFDTTDQDPSFIVTTPGQFDLPIETTIEGKIKLNIFLTGSDTTAAWPSFTLGIADTSNNVSASFALEEINNYLREVYSQLDKSGERTFTLEETWTTGTNVLLPQTYKFRLLYNAQGSSAQSVTIAKDGNTESEIEITSLRDSADDRIMQIPLNMPFGENGITCLDFISGIQKKYNLVISPSKTQRNHFEIETFNDWYTSGSVVDFDSFIDISKPIKITPANNLAVNELEFGDQLGKDYLAKLFDEANNRPYGTSYYKDNSNQFSQGKVDVKTTFGVSPLRYVEGTGTTSGSTAPTSYAHNVIYSNSATFLCYGGGGTFTTLYTNNSDAPGFGDTLYWNSLLTIPFTGYSYIDNLVDPDLQYVESSTGLITGTQSC